MKIKILKATSCGGKVRKVGATVDASDRDGRLLIGLGKAEEAKNAPKKEPAKKKAPSNKKVSVDSLETR